MSSILLQYYIIIDSKINTINDYDCNGRMLLVIKIILMTDAVAAIKQLYNKRYEYGVHKYFNGFIDPQLL